MCIAARLAKLIVEEYEVRCQKTEMRDATLSDGGIGFLKELDKEIKFRDD